MPFSLPLCLSLHLIHFSVCICFFLLALRQLSAADLWKTVFYFALLNVYLLNVSFCCSPRKHLKYKWYLSRFLLSSTLYLPVCPTFFHVILFGWWTVGKKNRGSTGKELIYIIFPALSLAFLFTSLLKQRQILLWPFAFASRFELLS